MATCLSRMRNAPCAVSCSSAKVTRFLGELPSKVCKRVSSRRDDPSCMLASRRLIVGCGAC
eukprot:3150675-Pleurochrysis_carterae.AAC.2